MKAQALGDTSSLEFMRGRRILEVNPEHPIIKDLKVRLLELEFWFMTCSSFNMGNIFSLPKYFYKRKKQIKIISNVLL